jgi:hypothetical protein
MPVTVREQGFSSGAGALRASAAWAKFDGLYSGVREKMSELAERLSKLKLGASDDDPSEEEALSKGMLELSCG